MTYELNVGHYLKRLIAINIQFGDPAFHILRCAEDVLGSASVSRHETPVAAGSRANVA